MAAISLRRAAWPSMGHHRADPAAAKAAPISSLRRRSEMSMKPNSLDRTPPHPRKAERGGSASLSRALERRNAQKEAAKPAYSLGVGLGAAPRLRNANIGDLAGQNRVARPDADRVDLTGKPQHIDVVGHADLLFA